MCESHHGTTFQGCWTSERTRVRLRVRRTIKRQANPGAKDDKRCPFNLDIGSHINDQRERPEPTATDGRIATELGY
jgi:hypothetical protein